MDRRSTIKWMMAASASWPLMNPGSPLALPKPSAGGYGSDPDLSRNYHAGELWPLTLTPSERQLAGVLADLIIPADDQSTSASAAGVVDFIDEWVSAPYVECRRDKAIVLGGFAWLDSESERRARCAFIDLAPDARAAVCDDVRDATRVAPELTSAAHFFGRFRDLTAGGFYSSPVGRQDLNYIGNRPLANFEGPPLALLQSLGLA